MGKNNKFFYKAKGIKVRSERTPLRGSPNTFLDVYFVRHFLLIGRSTVPRFLYSFFNRFSFSFSFSFSLYKKKIPQTT